MSGGKKKKKKEKNLRETEKCCSEYVSSRDRGEADWYLRDGGMAPYQQRQMAQLTTSSDYAVCHAAAERDVHERRKRKTGSESKKEGGGRARVRGTAVAQALCQLYCHCFRCGAGAHRH